MARILLTHVPPFDTVRQVAELVAGRIPPHAATRLARLRKA